MKLRVAIHNTLYNFIQGELVIRAILFVKCSVASKSERLTRKNI